MISKQVGVQSCNLETVRNRVEELLNTLPCAPDLGQLMRAALSEPSKILCLEVPSGKTKLVTLVYNVLNGDPDPRLIEAAAAIEIIIPAFDIIDDVQDGKLSEGVARPVMGQWLNAALYLIYLGQQVLNRSGFETTRLNSARQFFNSQVLQAIDGQQADLVSEASLVDSQMALGISSRKSGSLIRGIFELSASLAGAEERIVGLSGQIGQLLGTSKQLKNDLGDLRLLTAEEAEANEWRNSDIAHRKKTLPVTFALNFAKQYPSPEYQFLLEYYQQSVPVSLDVACYNRLAQLIQNSGAAVCTQVIIELHRNQAEPLVAELKQAGYPEADRFLELF